MTTKKIKKGKKNMGKKESKDELGTRMKEFYENRAKTQLIRRMPVIMRIGDL